MASLYEINEAILSCIDLESGEIIDEAALEALQMQRDEKLENVGLWIKNLAAESSAMAAEIKALTDRKRAKENKTESLMEYLRSALHGERFDTPRISVSWRKSEVVNIEDGAILPDEYLVPVAPRADKTLLKKALKEGAEICGVELISKQNIQIK
jgi:vacuolar-type H+-ATPase subunit I/STV1